MRIELQGTFVCGMHTGEIGMSISSAYYGMHIVKTRDGAMVIDGSERGNFLLAAELEVVKVLLVKTAKFTYQ